MRLSPTLILTGISFLTPRIETFIAPADAVVQAVALAPGSRTDVGRGGRRFRHFGRAETDSGACAADFQAHFPIGRVLLASFARPIFGQHQQDYPAGNGSAAILCNMPANNRRVR